MTRQVFDDRLFEDRRAATGGRGLALLAIGLCAGLMCAGCGQSKRAASSKSKPQQQAETQGELFRSVADNINRLEEFNLGQMIPQVRDRLNQWVINEHPKVDWRREPLLADLPKELADLNEVKQLESLRFSDPDVSFLQESVWLRDIGQRAQAGAFDDVETAERLFDWTVRNLQLSPDGSSAAPPAPHSPRDVLFMSRATAEQRMWIFAMLARQRGLDVVVLALPQKDGQPPRPWVAALVTDQDLYLFDPRLGFALPGPDGKGVATLAQMAADDKLLRGLDLDEKHPYRVEAADLREIVPWIEASPEFLAKRMKLIETRLAGANKIVLSVDPTALAARLAKIPQLAKPAIWLLPYETRRQQAHMDQATREAYAKDLLLLPSPNGLIPILPQLMFGRALAFKGQLDDPSGGRSAKPQRRRDADDAAASEATKGATEDAAGARRLLMSARPSESELQQVKNPQQRAALEAAKQTATFWLGTIAFEERDYPVAADFFWKRMMLEAPDGILFAAAQYNLARTYEASGETAKAIKLFDDDPNSPQRHGNRLRARRLQAAAAAESAQR